MSQHTQPPQGQVDTYLTRLRKQLAGLPPDDIEEILRELRGHIAERSAGGDSGQNSVPLEQVLRELGSPEHIASLYRADVVVAQARATFSPALIIRATIRWATRTAVGFVAFLIGVIGYAVGAALIACAVLKPFLPDEVGLWTHPLLLGVGVPKHPGPELLGWWLIPNCLILGAALVLGTTVFLRWMLRFVPLPSSRVPGVLAVPR